MLNVLSKAHVAMYMPVVRDRIAYNVLQDVILEQGVFRIRNINTEQKYVRQEDTIRQENDQIRIRHVEKSQSKITVI